MLVDDVDERALLIRGQLRGDPMYSPSQRIWAYETPDGSFVRFCRAQDRQLLERPKHLSWEKAACYTLTLTTAYRMLFGHEPHQLKSGDNVLVWGVSGGLVSSITLSKAAGGVDQPRGKAEAVGDDDRRADSDEMREAAKRSRFSPAKSQEASRQSVARSASFLAQARHESE
ncbi:MAG: Crotonyl-CoA reductase [Methylocystaceae bacterium]|nr:MAG: Crotonyl-CoA reductase [Methylocystaceae bacterium]TXT42298.1 MAG: Crotonyl-CoA reductase [Methylocystaceae bacterium]